MLGSIHIRCSNIILWRDNLNGFSKRTDNLVFFLCAYLAVISNNTSLGTTKGKSSKCAFVGHSTCKMVNLFWCCCRSHADATLARTESCVVNHNKPPHTNFWIINFKNLLRAKFVIPIMIQTKSPQKRKLPFFITFVFNPQKEAKEEA